MPARTKNADTVSSVSAFWRQPRGDWPLRRSLLDVGALADFAGLVGRSGFGLDVGAGLGRGRLGRRSDGSALFDRAGLVGGSGFSLGLGAGVVSKS
jgi:hypothetical protein